MLYLYLYLYYSSLLVYSMLVLDLTKIPIYLTTTVIQINHA